MKHYGAIRSVPFLSSEEVRMKFQQATLSDLPRLTKIMTEAIELLKKQGSPQWQNGHGPTAEKLTEDIKKHRTYILKTADDEIAGTIALIPGIDPAYTAITEGKWQGDAKYLAFHKVAINQQFRGQKIAAKLLEAAVHEAINLGIQDLRIDTHELNLGMQKVIKEAGFDYCGVVHFPIPDGKRLAYQKIV